MMYVSVDPEYLFTFSCLKLAYCWVNNWALYMMLPKISLEIKKFIDLLYL